MNKILVHHRSIHHAKNSGYGRLIDYMDVQVVYGKPRYPFRFWKFLADRHSQKAGSFDAGGMLKMLELNEVLLKKKGQKNMVHFLNGERDIRYLGYFKSRFPHTKFVATFHKPPEILKKNIHDVSTLKKLDGAIAVGANQVQFLKDWLQMETVKYIPHGVDAGFFKPDHRLKQNHTLLFVGQHLRDFDTFNRTIPKLVAVINDLKVNVVIHRAYKSKILPHPNLEIFSRIDDKQLRNLYQQATALYLPMLDSTACNSLLEAMACGLPIITSNSGGNGEYLKETSSILINDSNEQDYINKTIAILQDKHSLREMGETSRARSLCFDWTKTSKLIDLFYQRL